ncbi:MAG: hypothetical protein K9K64_06040 [Desulfohalobiaceae bacterium]|nr:hypothetical protein [Desulfohalobiaceae bacterium]
MPIEMQAGDEKGTADDQVDESQDRYRNKIGFFKKYPQTDHESDQDIAFPGLKGKGTTRCRQKPDPVDIIQGNPFKTKTIDDTYYAKSKQRHPPQRYMAKGQKPDSGLSAEHDPRKTPEQP